MGQTINNDKPLGVMRPQSHCNHCYHSRRNLFISCYSVLSTNGSSGVAVCKCQRAWFYRTDLQTNPTRLKIAIKQLFLKKLIHRHALQKQRIMMKKTMQNKQSKRDIWTSFPVVTGLLLLLSFPMTTVNYPLFKYSAQASVLTDNTLLRRYIVTDGKAILRYALPIPMDEPIRKLQMALENGSLHLHAPGVAGWTLAQRDIQSAADILHHHKVEMVLDTNMEHRQEAVQRVSQLEQLIASMQTTTSNKNRWSENNKLMRKRWMIQLIENALENVGQLEESMVREFPYVIPHKFDALPRLKGRAEIEIVIQRSDKESPQVLPFRDSSGNPIGKSITLVAVLDGYRAPLTSGNFIDLVLQHFYDDCPIVAKDAGFFLLAQPKTCYTDPETNTIRNIPMEVFMDGDDVPLWGKTLESAGLADLQPLLPMTAFGAMAMRHSEDNENDANASFFLFLLDPRSEQARNKGGNILNGNVATFGYIIQGKEYLSQILPSDTIQSIRLQKGLEYWQKKAIDWHKE